MAFKAGWDLLWSYEDEMIEWYISPYTDANEHTCDDCGVTYYETHSCIYMDTYYTEMYNSGSDSSDLTPNCDDCTDGSSSCPNASAH